ncbi:MAG: hypothetical protein V3U75_01355 [Methylococcaceae bacterium]
MVFGATIVSTIAMGIVKNFIARMAKPDKIAEILVNWLVEIAEKDEKKDWKDKLAKLLEEK